MYWYMPGLCREYVSSFDDCIPLETLSYEQLNGVSFSGVNIIMNNNKTCICVGMFPFVKI